MVTSKILSKSYQLLQLIGKGTFGEVHLAKQILNNEQVAIKIIYKSKNELQLGGDIQKEIINAQKVKSDNIIQIRQYFYDHDMCCLWIVMPKYQYSLRHLIKMTKKFTNAQIKSFILQMVSAFLELNSKKIMHLDVKPENIMIESIKDQLYHYVLIDLGCSQYSFQTKFYQYKDPNFGTLDYLAPQNLQQFSQQKFRSSADVWSLGVIIFEMIFGSLPYSSIEPTGKTIINGIQEFYQKGLKVYMNSNKEASKEIIELVYSMLSPNPSKRIDWRRIKEYLFNHLHVEPYQLFDIRFILFCANAIFQLFLAFIKLVDLHLQKSKDPIWKNNKEIIKKLLYSIIIYAQKLYNRVIVGQAYRLNLFGSAQKNTLMELIEQMLKLKNSFVPITNPYENGLLDNLRHFKQVVPCKQQNNSHKFMRTFTLDLQSVLGSEKDLLSNVQEFKRSLKLKR